MAFINTDTWEPVQDVDITKRWPVEWAKIYGVELKEPYDMKLMNEYEFAYNFVNNYDYIPIKKMTDGLPDFDAIADKELRASLINRDIFKGADVGERALLKYNYVETQWYRDNFVRI